MGLSPGSPSTPARFGSRLARAPLLHFLAIGALAFAFEGALEAPGPALGEAPADAKALERQARALGLHQRDPIVRRHLATLMRGLLSRLEPADWPDEADLAAHLAAHADRFALPARLRLSHVYLSRDRRGDALPSDARHLRQALVRNAVDPAAAADLGDPFPLGSVELLASERELDATFGPGFATALRELEPGAWSAPVASAYGLHLVLVHERLPAQPAPLAQVRGRVLHRVLAERRQARLRARLAGLHERYRAS
jgi:hypothetical protein